MYSNQILQIIALSITGISFICSCLVLMVIYQKKLYKNVTNQFIIQITISEMINNLTNLSTLINDILVGKRDKFYTERMRVCFAQMFSGLFSNLFTLMSSLLVAYRIYDLLVNNSSMFRSNKFVKGIRLFSIYITLFISYVIWMIQLVFFQNYSRGSNYTLIITCWIGQEMNYFVISIFVLLILLMFFFCFKARKFIEHYTKNIIQDDSSFTEETDENGKTEQINKAKQVQNKLILYPITTGILFTFITAYSITSFYVKDTTTFIPNNTMRILSMIFYIIPTVSRGFIFSIIYLGSQNNVKQTLWDYLTCKNWNKPKVESIRASVRTLIEEE